jgi:hypothetical protein
MNPGDPVICSVCRREGQIPPKGEDPRVKKGEVYVCLRCQRRNA